MQTIAARRSGLTLIELLVVISIIGVLVLLIMPAVQSSRETARRAECVNRLKQMGLAVSNFESANRHFPSLVPGIDLGAGRQVSNGELSFHFQVLPYLDQKPLFDAINFQPNVAALTNKFSHWVNKTALETQVNTFLCPSDRQFSTSGNNYRANLGPYPHFFEEQNQPGGGGPFKMLVFTSVSEITDGLSTTAALSERIVGNGEHSKFNRSRDFWFSGAGGIDPDTTADEFLELCGLALAKPSVVHGRFGANWLSGYRSYTIYDHVFTPNASYPDCSSDVVMQPFPDSFSTASISARSWHSGGVHVAFMDGSVRFVKNAVSLQVWRAAATRAGNDRSDGL